MTHTAEEERRVEEATGDMNLVGLWVLADVADELVAEVEEGRT